MGEHLPCKQGVMSSNLTISTDPKGSKASYGSASAKAGVGALKTEYRKANIDILTRVSMKDPSKQKIGRKL